MTVLEAEMLAMIKRLTLNYHIANESMVSLWALRDAVKLIEKAEGIE